MKQTERRSLKYEFSNPEILELSKELANKTQETRQLEEQKKSVVSEYASKTNIAREQVLLLSDKVASGYEVRDVECEVQYHSPTEGMKTLTREDNGYTWMEKMTGSDYTLFNQYQSEAKDHDEVFPIITVKDGFGNDKREDLGKSTKKGKKLPEESF